MGAITRGSSGYIWGPRRAAEVLGLGFDAESAYSKGTLMVAIGWLAGPKKWTARTTVRCYYV